MKFVALFNQKQANDQAKMAEAMADTPTTSSPRACA